MKIQYLYRRARKILYTLQHEFMLRLVGSCAECAYAHVDVAGVDMRVLLFSVAAWPANSSSSANRYSNTAAAVGHLGFLMYRGRRPTGKVSPARLERDCPWQPPLLWRHSYLFMDTQMCIEME